MEAIILSLVPQLSNYPFLLAIVEVIFALYFGGMIFSSFWGLLTGFRGFK